MTRMTGPDCAVMCNLINTHTHTHTLSSAGMPDMMMLTEGDVSFRNFFTR